MPRNSSGLYVLPESAFIAGTVIRSSPVNNDFSDIATALTQSLATTGVSEMTGPIKSASGSVAAPAITWASSLGTGWYRIADNEIGYAVNGVNKATYFANGSFAFTAIAFANADVVGNILDWYEEGTFTPTVAFGGSSVGVTYSLQEGKFVRIGKIVHINIHITMTSNGAVSGIATVQDLPYAAAGLSVLNMNPLLNLTGLGEFDTNIAALTGPSSTVLALVAYALNLDTSFPLTEPNMDTTDFLITGFYIAE